MKIFTQSIKARHVLPIATTAGNRTGATIDCRGFLGCVFVIHHGISAAAATGTIKVQGSHDGTTWADLAGPQFTLGAIAADRATVWDILKPRHRYLRIVKTATNAENTIEGALAYQYRASSQPVPGHFGASPIDHRYHAPEEA